MFDEVRGYSEMNFACSRCVAICFLLVLLLPFSYAKVALVMGNQVIDIGETIELSTDVEIMKVNQFKPIVPIPSQARNVQIKDSNDNIIFYERFNATNYAGLQNYLTEECSVDEEGWGPYDEGVAYCVDDDCTELLGAGYCENYENMVPENDTDILLLNHEGIGVPIIVFKIQYELPVENPPLNFMCGGSGTYILPAKAIPWDISRNSSPLYMDEIDGRAHIFVDYGENICMSFGTQEQKSSYGGQKEYWWTWFATVLGILFATALTISLFFATDKKVYYGTLWVSLIVSLFLTMWFLGPFRKDAGLTFPPFSFAYIRGILLIESIFVLLVLFLLPTIWVLMYKTCPRCKMVVKKRYLSSHLRKVHDVKKR